MAQKSRFTATKLRVVLIAMLITTAILAAGLFYISQKQLTTIASSVGQSLSDANASQNNIATLKQIEKELADNHDIVERASKVVADSQQYNYQNVIVRDLNAYADRNDLTITNISFGSGQTSGASASPAPTTGDATATPAAGAATGSLATTQVVITLKTPVPYENLLHFLRALELNLTKMQVASVKLNKAGEDAKSVDTQSLTIELHTK